jgi:hypothetical protein
MPIRTSKEITALARDSVQQEKLADEAPLEWSDQQAACERELFKIWFEHEPNTWQWMLYRQRWIDEAKAVNRTEFRHFHQQD